MDIYQYLQVILRIERKLAEYFIKIAEYHKSEHEIYYGCQEMASISNEHIRDIKQVADRTDENYTFTSEKVYDSLIRDYERGLSLETDLRLLWLLAKEAGFFYSLLKIVSESSGDTGIALVCSAFEQESARQSSWLFSRIIYAAETGKEVKQVKI